MMREQPQTNTAAGDLKIIRLNSRGINELEAPHVEAYPYRLEATFRVPQLMEVAFIGMYGPSEELVIRARTHDALDHFIEKNTLSRHPRLSRMTITGPHGLLEEILR